MSRIHVYVTITCVTVMQNQVEFVQDLPNLKTPAALFTYYIHLQCGSDTGQHTE